MQVYYVQAFNLKVGEQIFLLTAVANEQCMRFVNSEVQHTLRVAPIRELECNM